MKLKAALAALLLAVATPAAAETVQYAPGLPMQRHDSPLDWIVTPDEVIETKTPYPQPGGIDWDAVQPDQYDSIPALRTLRPHG